MKRKLIAFLIVCTIMLTGCGSDGDLVQIQEADNNSKLLRVISGNSLLLMANYSNFYTCHSWRC